MSDVRDLFDFVIEQFLGMPYYLSADANMIQNLVLGRALVKIQDGQQVTAEEIFHAQCFELPVTAITTAEDNVQEESESYADIALKRQRIRVAAPASTLERTTHTLAIGFSSYTTHVNLVPLLLITDHVTS